MVIIKVCSNVLFSIYSPIFGIQSISFIWLLNTCHWKWEIFSIFFVMKNWAVVKHGSRTLHQQHKSHSEQIWKEFLCTGQEFIHKRTPNFNVIFLNGHCICFFHLYFMISIRGNFIFVKAITYASEVRSIKMRKY